MHRAMWRRLRFHILFIVSIPDFPERQLLPGRCRVRITRWRSVPCSWGLFIGAKLKFYEVEEKRIKPTIQFDKIDLSRAL